MTAGSPVARDGLRGLLWAAGGPARAVLLGVIAIYRLLLSGWLGGQCRYYPSCSRYAEEAIRVHGAIRGTALAAWRVLRCGPFTRGGVDHVPARRRNDRATGPRTDEASPVAVQGKADAA